MVTLQNGNIVPKSKIDEYEALRLKYNLKVKTAIRLQNDIVDNLDDIKALKYRGMSKKFAKDLIEEIESNY